MNIESISAEIGENVKKKIVNIKISPNLGRWTEISRLACGI